MGEKLSAFGGSVKEFWSKISKGMRILLLGGIAGVLLLSLIIVLLLNHTDYIVLYNNLTVEENAGILAQLQEMGVEGKLEGNSILIPAEQENMVRMQLAVRGAPVDGFGYDTYQLGSGLTSTQYDKNFYDKAQQQERLEAMIKTFAEVRDAHVTLTIPENSIFVLQEDVQKPSASVKIQKNPGRSLSPEQIQGILNLVRNAVPGLEEDNIAIVDESGDLRLSMSLAGDIHSTKLKLTDSVNRSMENRILAMLTPLYGDDHVVVKVNSILNTDEQTTEKIDYIPPEDPNNPLKDYEEIEWERQAGTQVAQGVPGANDNIDVPQYAAQVEDDGTGPYYRNHAIYDYLVSSERNQIIKAGLTITDLTVAVLIDKETLGNTERDQVFDLVAKASGVEQEKVSVQGMTFARGPAIDLTGPASRTILGLPVGVFFAILLIIVSLIIILIVWMVSKRKKEQLAAEGAMDEEASLLEMIAEREAEFEPIQLAESQEQKLRAQIKDLANSDPEIVAQLIRTWLLN